MMRRWLVGIWLIALLASNGWRLVHPPQPSPAAHQLIVRLPARAGDTRAPGTVAVTLTNTEPRAPRGLPVLLVHGTPVASPAMAGLADALSGTRRVLNPDLPGFGTAVQPLPDYSSITHGAYLVDLLDALDVERAHVVAYSQGGAAAISMADRAPQRVASLTLASSIGLQRYELFGSYRANQLVYDAQHVLLTGLRWLVPHFGYLDGAVLGRGYTRNLIDTDQRRLAPMLRRLTPPVLIVHGRDDGLVPLAAAQAHRALVPQSRLVVIDGGHEPVYARPRDVAAVISPFLDAVESGAAPGRAEADRARVAASRGELPAFERSRLAGAGLVVLLLALFAATYVSEDLTCISAGLLVAQGVIGFAPATLACLAGIFTSDLALFAAGRGLGPPALSRLVSPERMQVAAAWLRRRGPMVILASRFMPGTRLPTYTAAGALRMPWRRFAGYFAVATALWTPLLVGAATIWGDVAARAFERYAHDGLWFVIAGGLLMWLLVRFGLPLLTWRGRRRLYGRWQRLRRFEFWPRWAFYPPVVTDSLWHALRHRSATVVTLANPGIPLGGLVGESKSDILDGLAASGSVVPYRALPAGGVADRLDMLTAFAADQGWPIVLKPDRGERGRDVAFVADADDAAAYLAAHAGPLIAQRKAEGTEFGVFYIREPGAAAGRLFSITRKGATHVTGDGHHTLADLILIDSRAVCMADFFFREHADTLDRVPAAGERVVLNRIGTHSRGSLFTDAGDLATPALAAEIDRISKCFDGFHLGRYDLMADDEASLAAGRDLRVIELNGISSEATHIYDPSMPLLQAWRITRLQWRTAWRIGAHYRRLGLEPPPLRAVWQALRS